MVRKLIDDAFSSSFITETLVTCMDCSFMQEIAEYPLIMVALVIFVNKTKPGKAMLAVSEDKGAAQLMGINVNGTIALTFAIGSALAGAAGVIFGIYYTRIEPLMGVLPGLKAFVAAVLGGIGIIPGAMVGGLLLGVIYREV